ncbi:hypothetical protein QA600_09300 [Natronococcus sp. A-GB1]|uniref:hypothetical protein n=1 Tax=Natronococcus sp. A-GB1 TaxID=3037648 RepID=UPI00241F92BC|nr:hypothetical protein [Natronococcus sp. A-GB1]MDG5759535.1 hypothetical protein [Natronococcus sp. A-GB1]
MTRRYCPKCNVEMEATAVTTAETGGLYVKTERESGLLERLGIGESTALDAFLCPDCGLTQLYADLEE